MAQARKGRATLKNVAEMAGVNFTLVSKFVTGNPQARMTDATRERIRAAIEKLNYRPSASARSLRIGRSRTVGLVIGDLTNAYCAHFANVALRELDSLGYGLLIALDNAAKDGEVLDSLFRRDVDGVIYLGHKNPARSVPPCPVILNDSRARGCLSVNLDLKDSLRAAFESVSGKIAGLFFENSLWLEEFEREALMLRKNAVGRHISYDPVERLDQIRQVCSDRPDAIFTSGWLTMTALQNVLDTDFKGYSPKLLLHANCSGEFLRDRRIAGVIHSSSVELIRATCRTLVSQIESPSIRPPKPLLPTSFVNASSKTFRALLSRSFKLT